MNTIPDAYVPRGDALAARFCGFRSVDKFRKWAVERGLASPVKRKGKRCVYRIADLRAALDTEAAADKPAKALLFERVGVCA